MVEVLEVTTLPDGGNRREILRLKNDEVSINYTRGIWKHDQTITDDVFSYTVVTDIIHDDYELYSIKECNKGMISLNGKMPLK